MNALKLLDDIIIGLLRNVNPFDGDGLYKDDDDLCDHCGKLLLFSSSGLCDDCEKKAGYRK